MKGLDVDSTPEFLVEVPGTWRMDEASVVAGRKRKGQGSCGSGCFLLSSIAQDFTWMDEASVCDFAPGTSGRHLHRQPCFCVFVICVFFNVFSFFVFRCRRAFAFCMYFWSPFIPLITRSSLFDIVGQDIPTL